MQKQETHSTREPDLAKKAAAASVELSQFITRVLPGRVGPATAQIIDRLVPQNALDFRRSQTVEIVEFKAAPQLDIPRSSLKKLTSFIHRVAIQDCDQPLELAKGAPGDQLMAHIRTATQTALADISMRVWRDLAQHLTQGYIPFRKDTAHSFNFKKELDEVPGKFDIWQRIPLDEKFPKLVGARNLRESLYALRLLLGLSCDSFIEKNLPRESRDPSTQELEEVLTLRNAPFGTSFSVHDALSAGFSTGTFLTVASLQVLMDRLKDQKLSKPLSQEDLWRMVEEHRHFVLPFSQWAFQQFAILDTVLQSPDINSYDGYVSRFYNPSQLLYDDTEILGAIRNTVPYYNPKYFRCILSAEVGSIPTLDFNLESFLAEELEGLSRPARALGCPAMEVVKEFVPWLLDTAHKTCIEPFYRLSK